MPSGVCSFGLREDKGPFAGVTSFTMLKSYLWSTGVMPFECRNSVMEVSRSSRFENENVDLTLPPLTWSNCDHCRTQGKYRSEGR